MEILLSLDTHLKAFHSFSELLVLLHHPHFQPCIFDPACHARQWPDHLTLWSQKCVQLQSLAAEEKGPHLLAQHHLDLWKVAIIVIATSRPPHPSHFLGVALLLGSHTRLIARFLVPLLLNQSERRTHLRRAASSADRPEVSLAPLAASRRFSLSAASFDVASWTAICSNVCILGIAGGSNWACKSSTLAGHPKRMRCVVPVLNEALSPAEL